MKLLITRKIPQNAIDILSKYNEIEIDYRQGPPLSETELIDAIADVDAIIPVIPDKITSKIIDAGKNLKLIAHFAVGYDNIDVEYATKKGIYVSNTPGDLTQSVAEFTLGLMFAISKNIVDADRFTRGEKYKSYDYWDPLIYLGPTLFEKTLGIVGMGRIGTYLAEMAFKGLNMKILYFDPKNNEKADSEFGAKRVELEELLENSDFISLNCPLTEESRHLISHQQFELMKPTAYLINTARGPVVNEAALYNALKNNYIAGAALDVFENEPELYPGLAELENVILTPHIASATREARIQMARMVAQNVTDVLINKKPPTNLVNKELANKTSSLF